ncbi:MAG: hypothetical protein LBG26_04535 [Treponema sp.]|jgi:hypothetical protein|nr:hypothetical protein [Treponema sp.]
MRKVLTILILLGLAGACFFLGWAQFQVPPGSYGVIRSKTHGTDGSVVRPGEFRWVWYKLIPTNTTVQVYTMPESSFPIEIKGSLPSGDVYSAMAGLKTDFSYELKGSVSCSLRPEALPGMVERRNMASQEDLDTYVKKLSLEIESRVRENLWSYAEKEDVLERIRASGSIPELEQELKAAFPDTDNLTISVEILKFPDFVLYREVRGFYEDYIARQRQILSADLGRMAEETISSRRRFDELTLYGELLSKYPILLNYLALEKGIPPSGNVPGESPVP